MLARLLGLCRKRLNALFSLDLGWPAFTVAAPEPGMELVELAARSAVVDFFFLSSAAAPPRASLDPEASRELLVLPARVPSEPARWV